ncbi:MAG: thiol:disulfide interchange protein, partial [Sulfuricella sp.]|nr:thiol:disulfide interchange protein [Sulfuricella sp.]
MRFLVFLLFCLSQLAHAADSEPLEAAQAFRMSARAVAADTLEVRYQIADGYYLYRERFKFAVEPAEYTLGEMQIPAGKVKQDEFFGKVETYRHEVVIRLPLSGAGNAKRLTLKATAQGCADMGICYPPFTQSAEIALDGTAATSAPTAAKSGDTDSSRIANLFKGGSFWLVIASFFGFGLLLALTPCVFPMIPILSGIIVGQGQHLTKGRTFVLSLSYVLGMAITYAL